MFPGNPRLAAENNLNDARTRLDLHNMMLVTHIRVSALRERLNRNHVLDVDGQMYLHVNSHMGREKDIDRTRGNIVAEIWEIILAENFIQVWDDAMHKSSHEVLGECTYQYDEVYNKETGHYDPVLSQPCEIWYPKGKR